MTTADDRSRAAGSASPAARAAPPPEPERRRLYWLWRNGTDRLRVFARRHRTLFVLLTLVAVLVLLLMRAAVHPLVIALRVRMFLVVIGLPLLAALGWLLFTGTFRRRLVTTIRRAAAPVARGLVGRGAARVPGALPRCRSARARPPSPRCPLPPDVEQGFVVNRKGLVLAAIEGAILFVVDCKVGIKACAVPLLRTPRPRYARAMRRATAIALTVIGYLGFALLLTWPLGAVIATELPHVAGDFVSDLYLAGWALAWQSHALVTHPAEIANANIYGGAPRALFYSTPGFGMLPVHAPLFLASGNPTLALNGAILGLLALTATMLHLVTRSWTGSHLAGVAAGSTFLASKTALVMCAIMPQYVALAPLPAIVWLVARPELGRGAMLGLAALVALQGLTDVVYVALPIVLVLGLAAVVYCLRAPTRPKGLRILVALALAVAALSPVYAQYLAVRAANPHLATQSVWRGTFFDWVDLRTGLPLGYGPLALDPVALVPALAGFLLGVTGVVAVSPARARAWRHAWLWFLTSFMIAWVLPLQYPTFRDAVLGSVVRDFLRLGLPALIAACLLTGLGFAACADAFAARVRPGWRPAVAPLLVAVVVAFRIGHARYLPGEYPTHPAPLPGPEAEILRAGAGPVLVLPVGDPRKDSGSHAHAMYRSIGHWRTLVNGYSSYYPSGFRERIELARRLPDGDVLDTFRRDTRLTTVVVYAGAFPEMTIGRWRAALASDRLPGVRVDYDDGAVMVLAIDSQGW